MATLKLEIVTPQEVAYSDDVEMVVVPGQEGELGVYPQHIPLMTQVVPGELRILKGGQEHLFAIGDGFVEIDFDSVSILTDMAVDVDDIDEQEVAAAVERAQKALREGPGTDEEVAAVEASLQKSITKLAIKRRRKV